MLLNEKAESLFYDLLSGKVYFYATSTILFLGLSAENIWKFYKAIGVFYRWLSISRIGRGLRGYSREFLSMRYKCF